MNKELLAELYLRYAREVYLYVYSLCRSRAAAEDLTQETFVRALVSLNDAHPNFRAWLYLTAKNLCLNEVKREKRNKGGKTEAFSGEKKDLLEEYLKTERERLLYACIRRLPQNEQTDHFSGIFCRFAGEGDCGGYADQSGKRAGDCLQGA